MLTNIRLDLKQDKVIDPSMCPICGEPNKCAQEIAKATRKPPERCWCMTATFSSEVLDRVPEEAKNKACICSKCAIATAF
ncbi:MAG: cysteine-rich CWC family protein [Burkholderiaceae bacterium]